MGSASIVEDQGENTMSNAVIQTSESGTHSVKNVDMNDQFTSGDDFAPKARKPYTIRKQRERWAEEEHKKFLEALKLYGRAWRRIEEHVGTKTAVQIRSHAQKFFSKVVRESNGGDETEVKPIEIPPPRPKRKPMHPYPRKLASPNKTRTHICEQPNSSISEQENQSPTSVLSAVCCSDTSPMGQSCSPNDSSSPVSSPIDAKPSGLLLSDEMSPDENGFSSLIQEQDSSTPDQQVHVKSELCREDRAFVQEGSPEVGSTQSLKLFGKTVLVADTRRSSSPSSVTCKQNLTDVSEMVRVQAAVPWNMFHMNFSRSNTNANECSWNVLPCGPPVYYMQFINENSDLIPPASSSTPWWNLYGGLSFPFPQSQKQEAQEKELQKEGSLTGSNTGSNTGSGNLGGECDKNWDLDTQSVRNCQETEQNTVSHFKRSEGSAFSNVRAKVDKSRKGFVPYKRCLAERDTYSSNTGEERDEQRVRLCL